MRTILFLILAIISNTVFRYAPFDFQFGIPEENHTMYAVGQASSYLFLLLCAHREDWKDTIKTVWRIAICCAISNLVDEIWFNPLKLGWNEIVFISSIIIYETLIRKRTWITKIRLISGRK